ncbi:MAG: glycosyltransferase [Gammaproteobacteria bacterium]|nr:glycosyltransferase [Gammaproteobacteria bacterium]
MQVFVLGMHRSGTSAVARVLNLMGCYFGAEHEGTRANEENPKGFWERQDVRRLNDVMLRSVGCDWDRVSGFDVEAMQVEQAAYRRAMADIVLDMDAHRPWFVKEPRLCLLFPLWRPLLETPVCIHVHRSPMEVARSLNAQHGMPIEAGLALWEVYSIRALGASKGLPRRVVSYRELMRAPKAVVCELKASLSDFGYALRTPGKAELRAFLDESLHRQRDDGGAWDATATPSQRQLLDILTHAEANGMDSLPEVPSISGEALAVLREYEAGAETVESRRRRANAVERRQRESATDMQLALKQAELETTLRDLNRVTEERNRHQAEGRRLQESLVRVQRERGIARGEVQRLDEFRRYLSREVATVREESRQVREQMRRTERDAQTQRDRFDARERSSQRMIRELEGSRAALRLERRGLLARIDALSGLLDGFVASVQLLLSSRRWRIGHALLSLPHRLLLRDVPATAADRLREQGREYSDLQGVPLPARERPSSAPVARKSNAPPRKRSAPTPRLRRDVTVAVIAWDVGHNPLGRAYLVAEALSRSYTVVLLGFQFPRYGDAVWRPLRHAPFRTVAIPGASFPEFQQTLERLAPRIDADVVVACKARLPSVQLGLMLKAFRNRPLLVDVDDYELSFFRNRDPLLDVAGLDSEALTHPFEEKWTRYTESLLPHADRLLVSNPALATKFGGATVPHARDETKFDPDRHDRAETRRDLGLEQTDKVVMFVGTPRPHKGVVEVLDAVRSLGRDDYRFVIVGTPPEDSFEQELVARGGDTLCLVPDQPFEKLPALMAAADLVCLLQDPNNEISRFQLPAKVVDAMAMGVPVLATAMAPLAPLIDDELIEPVTAEILAEQIGHWLEAPAEERTRRTRRARERFLAEFSYDAIHRTLFAEVEACLDEPRALPAEARNFLGEQQRRYSLPVPATGDGLDIVVFWKQGDIGLYGRRVDMVIEHLARRPEVRRIAVFDAPFSVRQMWRRLDAEDFDHHEEVTRSKLVRRWGLTDSAKVSHHVFLFDSGSTAGTIGGVAGRTSDGGYPGEAAFAHFVAAELDLAGIDPRAAIFWHYPVLAPISELNERFQPRLSVVDVVDDLRTWPDRTEADREEYTQHYRTVLGEADVAFANCETVRDSMAAFFPDIALIPNGCDLDPVPQPPEDERFRQLCALKGPILGLVGNLEAKTDVALLDRLAQERPDCNLVLIGSTHAHAAVMELDRRPNVHFFGVVTYPEVKAWIARFDVALVPHLDTDQTRSMHPLKMLVYAAVGVPIVSTKVQNLGDFAPFIEVADSHEAFLEAVDCMLNGDRRPDKHALAALVQEHAWDGRVASMLSQVQTKLAAQA